MFYTFNQNNSGGLFHYDAAKGITHFVIVEAGSAKEANRRAEDAGLYFGGQDDCPCCGDRWHEQWDDDGTASPMVYDKSPAEFEDMWRKYFDGNSTAIHWKDKPFELVPSLEIIR